MKYGRYIHEKDYAEWEEDCLRWRGSVLTGEFSHWCFEFDALPMDETCDREWDCCTCCDDDRKDRK